MIPRTVDQLVAAARGGERRATARLLTMVERGGEPAAEVASTTWSHVGVAGTDTHVVGVTGPPGSGKSTLVAAWLTALAAEGRRPAVLAVDPSSPLTGGAILGDRVRMAEASAAGVFIRSMATRGHAGGLALAVPGMIRVLELAGFDPVVVETVGVGQVEVDVTSTTDTCLVVVTPGMGDAVQANKAGLLEVADLFAVNKSDRPDAADVRRDLELMLDLSDLTGHRRPGMVDRPAVVSTTATTGVGVGDLSAAVDAHRDALVAGGTLQERRRQRWQAEVRSHLDERLRRVVDGAVAGLEPSDRAPYDVAAALSRGWDRGAEAGR
ncbi:MAG: methylmalonyl Co-A mutase-associated GTPase MeaB [Actinomycetota bacterium]|nr:methylmalonyl Co-A mutase-associated GTPase MeaB [Actinomycetota bacterium]MEC9394507.1 methylmalonyl Co-A mutase-associated GTPase MeaB [Actinomycetota bacterium]MEE2957659.1 methylmalonyl Co-A mutase-associated GTPase MeaB [Actinomycetota bacterium]